MSGGYGFQGFIGVAKESAWGTPVAATDYVKAMSENVTLAIDRFDVANIIGGMYEPDDMAGVRRVSGDIVLAAHPIGVGYFLQSALGQSSGVEVTSGQAGFYRHTFTMIGDDWSANLSPQPSYTFEIFRDVASSHQIAGANVGAMQLSFAPNQDVRLTASVLAKTSTLITKTSPTFPGSPVNPFAFDTCSISIGGVANAKLEEATISIDNQLQGIPTLAASTDISKIKRSGPPMVRISGTIAFENVTEYLDFVNQTERAMLFNFTRASSFAMLIDAPRVVYTAFPLGIAGRDRQLVQFEARARYHTGSASTIRVVLTNTRSAYTA